MHIVLRTFVGLAASLSLTLASCARKTATPTDQVPSTILAKHVREVALPVSMSGVFDPSIAATDSDQRAWMSYSAVDPSPRWPKINTRTITTRLAYSDDRGGSWTDLGLRVNDITETQIGEETATWINEVSSLAFDPAAPAAERWQLYWHHYLDIADKGQFSNGWIGLKTAASPEELAQAKEVKLFAARIYDKTNDDPSSVTHSPVVGRPLLRLDTLSDDLAYCLAFTEPGAMVTPSGVYLALGCVQPRFRNIAGILGIKAFGVRGITVLLKCVAPCHPENRAAWKYIGTLLKDDEAQPFGAIGFSAPDLFSEDGHTYLLISPTSNAPVEGAYNGCLLVPFDDFERGKLSRMPNGRILVQKQIHGSPNSFNGDCTYQPSVPVAGFLYGEIKFADKPSFHIFKADGN
jgi:hypothetical protein